MNDVAVNILKRTNKLNIPIALLCRKVGVSRMWFENLKKRTPKALEAYMRICAFLDGIENGGKENKEF